MFIELKPGEKYPTKKVLSDNIESFTDAGYMLEEHDVIVDIDCLDKDVIRKILSYFNINTHIVWTDRGVHLYFKKPVGFRSGTRVCALGFTVEYKTKNSNKCVVVKRNGIARVVENQNIREDLHEIFKGNVKFDDLLGLDTNRNTALFNHRLKLNNFTQYREILKFINDYIIAEPLDEKEMQSTILRDGIDVLQKMGEYETADWIMRELKICVAFGNLYFYNGTHYINDDSLLKSKIYEYSGKVKMKFINEVFNQMECRAKRNDIEVMPIKFKNGVLNKGRFEEVDYTGFTVYYIPIEYDKNAEIDENVDNYLNQLTENDESYKKLITEILAHTLITDPEFKRLISSFFFFVGSGGNGKGTLLEVIRKILNYKNCSGLSIKQMSDERYFYSMFGKLANLGDDVEDSPINDKDMKMLKNVSTCDFVEIRKLFNNSTGEVLTTSLIFTSNHILKSFEKGESYKRRVKWLPMFTKPKKKDPKFITKLTSDKALKYWIKLIIDAYLRLYENATFTECEKVKEWNKEYHEENDGAELYLSDKSAEDFIGKTGPDVMQEYENWCNENDINFSKKMLNNALLEKFNIKTTSIRDKNKTVRRIYQNVNSL